MSVLGWIVSTVGVVGIGGAIALAFLAPAILAQLVKGALGILDAILSTRVGVALLVGGVCLISGDLFGDHYGYKRRVDADVAAQTKILAARVVTLEKTAAADKTRADADALVINELQEQAAATPANTKAAMPRAAIKRIGEIK